MKSRTAPDLIAVAVVLSALLTFACSGSGHENKTPTVTELPQSSPTVAPSRSTGVASVDAVIGALLARNLDQLLNDVRFEEMACVAEPSESNFGPQCPKGTPEGTPLPTFPFEFCSGGLVTTNDDVRQGFSAAFSASVPSVYAVVKTGTVRANTENMRNPGYSIVLDPGTPPSSTANATAWILDLDGRIVEMDFGCGPKTTAEVVQQQYAGQDFLLPPLTPATSTTYRVCESGDGWSLPSDSEQRDHLQVVGIDRVATDYSHPFAGDFTADAGGATVFRRQVFFAFVQDAATRDSAVAGSGLWTAYRGDAERLCPPSASAVQVLLLDYEVIAAHREDRVFFMTARQRPGHYQFIEVEWPASVADSSIGFSVTDEAGTDIAECCM